MKLENEFVVPVPRDEAWDVLMDVERIAPCMPGRPSTATTATPSRAGSRSSSARSPSRTAGSQSSSRRTRRPAGRSSTRPARRPAGRARPTRRSRPPWSTTATTTLVKVITDLNITGKPAQFGRGVMVEVGTKILGQFADCLAGQLGSGTPEPAAVTTDATPRRSKLALRPQPRAMPAPLERRGRRVGRKGRRPLGLQAGRSSPGARACCASLGRGDRPVRHGRGARAQAAAAGAGRAARHRRPVEAPAPDRSPRLGAHAPRCPGP